MAAACCSPLALNEAEKEGKNNLSQILRSCNVNHLSSRESGRRERSSSSTRSVPEAQVDDVAIHGDVGAEVVEHRGDVILSGKKPHEHNRAPSVSVSAARERDAHRELTDDSSSLPSRERDSRTGADGDRR